VTQVTEVHHFTYGAFNPIAAYLVAVLGSFLGLLATGRARSARSRSRRNRWLIIAAFSIGGAGIWLMHVTALLGFDVPQSPVRYNPWPTMASLVLVVVAVGIGLLVVGHGRRSVPKIVLAGFFTGIGLLAMHYTGMAGLHVSGRIHFHPALVVASGVIAVVACTAALWFAVSVQGGAQMAGAAGAMGAAVVGMHYTGMASMYVELSPHVSTHASGIKPLLMIVPITLVSAAMIIGVALSALQAMTDEEFTEGDGVPRRGMHAESPWSLKQASMTAMPRTPGGHPLPAARTSPRPVPRRARPLADEPLIEVHS
jgi:NO-binding membrane sensor protein with MHYT domain